MALNPPRNPVSTSKCHQSSMHSEHSLMIAVPTAVQTAVPTAVQAAILTAMQTAVQIVTQTAVQALALDVATASTMEAAGAQHSTYLLVVAARWGTSATDPQTNTLQNRTWHCLARLETSCLFVQSTSTWRVVKTCLVGEGLNRGPGNQGHNITVGPSNIIPIPAPT